MAAEGQGLSPYSNRDKYPDFESFYPILFNVFSNNFVE